MRLWGLGREEGGSRALRQGGSGGRPLSLEAIGQKATLPPGDAPPFPRSHEQAEPWMGGLATGAQPVRQGDGQPMAQSEWQWGDQEGSRTPCGRWGAALSRENMDPSEEL